MTEPAAEDILYHDGAIVNSVMLSADELDGAGSNNRTKILDDLVEDSRKVGKIFRMVRTLAITIISTFNIIDPKEDNKQKPKALAKNTAEQMQASMIKCEDNLTQTEITEPVSRKAAEFHPALVKHIDKFTEYLETVSDIEMKWQRYKTKLNGPMVATRNAITKTLGNIHDLRIHWGECKAIADSLMPTVDALKGNWGQERARAGVIQQPAVQQGNQTQRRWVAPSYQCEMLKEVETPNSFKNWREAVENWFNCGGKNFLQKESSMVS